VTDTATRSREQARRSSTAATDPLLEALAEDLDAGFADLVRTYQRVVYSVALRVSGQPPDAEDLAAEAFLRAYRALTDYDRDRIASLQPRSWLLTILLNIWRNTVRDRTRRPSQVPLDEAAEPPSPQAGVEELTERRETSRELAGMVALLPEPQRVAVVLRHVAGLSIAEIAAVLDCPEGTVKSHVSRGLQRLRVLYETPAPAAVTAPAPRRGQR
jgi:RNA polymerase sigma factor (sigma-70 family)